MTRLSTHRATGFAAAKSSAATLAAVALAALLLLPAIASALTVDEVITLVKLEIPDAQIIRKIEKDQSVFKLRPPEILRLKKQGVSDTLIRYMLGTASRKAGGQAATTVKTATDKPKRELTAAEKAAEDARMKEEALRLAEGQRKREEAPSASPCINADAPRRLEP